MAASRRVYSIINDLSFAAEDNFKLNGPILDKFCRKIGVKDFDTKWNPNPITSLDSQYTSLELEDFDILKPLLDHLVDEMYNGIANIGYRFKPIKEDYHNIIKSSMVSNDPSIMCFSGVDWHTDTWSEYPLRILIPLNTSTLYLFTTELYKPDTTIRIEKSLEYKNDNKRKLERGTVLTFNENCIHMASVLKEPSKNASVCLTLPHPIYSVMSADERRSFNNEYKRTMLTKFDGTNFLEYDDMKYTRHEWWSSVKNKYVVIDLRREFITKFGGLGYTMATYEGLTNTPFVEPTTQNAWEAFLIGVDLSYANNKEAVAYIHPW